MSLAIKNMSNASHQVFQTDKPTRWQRFKWGSRFIAAMLFLLLAILCIAYVLHQDPALPLKERFKKVLVEEKPLLQENKIAKEYKGMRQFISETKPHQQGAYRPQDTVSQGYLQQMGFNNADTSWNKFPCGIRSAFYVAWDPKSFFSLKYCLAVSMTK